MPRDKKRSSFALLGLPTEFGTVLLTFALVLLVSPYLSGADFGIFRVPQFSPSVRLTLMKAGPVAFLLVVLSFVPLWRSSVADKGTHQPTKGVVSGHVLGADLQSPRGCVAVEILALGDVPGAISDLARRWRHEPVEAPEGTDSALLVASELAMNAFRHGSASRVAVTAYATSIILDDNGREFNPLNAPQHAPGGSGAGLFALNHLRAQDRLYGIMYFPHLRWIPNDPFVNQVVVSLAPRHSSHDEHWEIRHREAVSAISLVAWQVAHTLDIRWGYRTYGLDIGAYWGVRKSETLSGVNNTVRAILASMPSTSRLTIRTRGNSLYRDFFLKSFPGLGDRVAVE